MKTGRGTEKEQGAFTQQDQETKHRETQEQKINSPLAAFRGSPKGDPDGAALEGNT